MHSCDGLHDEGRAVGAELAGVGERRDRARWQTSFASRRPMPGDHALIAQEPVHAHRVGGESAANSSAVMVAASGPSLSSGGLVGIVAVGRAPHAGAPFRALFGEQQRVGRPSSRPTVRT